jgi:neutral ceramidase
MTFTIAWEEAVITPTFPPWPSLWMGGYGWVPRGGRNGGVARHLRAQCMVIHDGDRPHVLLRVDVPTIPRVVHQTIRERVVSDGLVASNDFLISVSHTHSGPQIGCTRPDPFIVMGLTPADIVAVNGSTEVFVDALVELVRTAVNSDTVEVNLAYAEGDVQIGFNRIEGPDVLTGVPVLVARRTGDDAVCAVLFGYSCHPVSRGNDETFDSDFCGHASELVSERLGVPAFFFQGTAGDQDPEIPHGPDKVGQLGEKLADAVVDVVDNGAFTPVTGPIVSMYTEIELPFVVDLSRPEVQAELIGKYQARLDSAETTEWARRHAIVMLDQLKNGRTPTGVPMPVQRWRFDGLTILALGHEVLSHYHVAITELVDSPLWIMGYANEVECYIPGDETLWAGVDVHIGYEAGWTDDPLITGDATNMMAYGWPAPLASSPRDLPRDGDGSPGSLQRTVMDAVRQILAA